MAVPVRCALLSFACKDQGKGKTLWLAIEQAKGSKGKGKGNAKGKRPEESKAPSDTPDEHFTATIAKKATAEASTMNASHEPETNPPLKRLRRARTTDSVQALMIAPLVDNEDKSMRTTDKETTETKNTKETKETKTCKKLQRQRTENMDDNTDNSSKKKEEAESRKKKKEGKRNKRKTDAKTMKKLRKLRRAGCMKSTSAETLVYENQEGKDDKDEKTKVACHLIKGTYLEHLGALSTTL